MGSGYRPLMSGGSRRLWSFCVCVTGETHTLPPSPQHTHRLLCTFTHSETFFPLFWNKMHELASACGMTSTFVPADSTWPPQRRDPVAAGQLQVASGADEFHHHILSAVVFGKQQMFTIKQYSRLAGGVRRASPIPRQPFLLFLLCKMCQAAL